MPDLAVVRQALVSGILMGGIYAMVAVGFTLIFGVLKIMNFAYGEFVMLGMYATFLAYTLGGVDPYLSLVLVLPAFFLLGVIVQRLLIDRILDAPDDMQMILTFGLLILISNLALFFFTSDLQGIRVGYLEQIITVGGTFFRSSLLYAFLWALGLLGATYLFISRSRLGRAVRATADDRFAARVIGLPVRAVFWITFGLGSAIGAASGSILLPYLPASPDRGFEFTLLAIIVVVLGGMGSFAGSLAGGLAIGLTRSLGQVFMSAVLSDALSLGVVLVILLVRPAGLFGGKVARHVAF